MRIDVEFMALYEFLFDRFRAVRQDLVIQRYCNQQSIDIYKKILKFYLYSDYRLCKAKNYDDFMNTQHLTEVLNIIVASIEDSYADNALYLSIFLLYNLDNFKNIAFILSLPKEVR